MPKVSVIVPVYNAEAYLRRCLDSLVNQSLREIEIICINDGSTDKSPAILEEYAAKDSRIVLIHQGNRGPAAARNAGIERASGEFLAFLDSDDFFIPSALEKLYTRALKTSADITVCLSKMYNTKTGKFSRNRLAVKECPSMPVFSYRDIKGRFDFLMWWPWDKLFKHSFISEHKLRFQDIARYEDAFFVLLALYKAERITVLRKFLIMYRTGREDSLSGTQEQAPTCFYEASKMIRAELKKMAEEQDGFDDVMARYTVWVIQEGLRILGFLSTLQAFTVFYTILRDSLFREYTLDERHRRYITDKNMTHEIQKIMSMTAEEYLFSSRKELQRYNRLVSYLYKIGKLILWPVRGIRK